MPENSFTLNTLLGLPDKDFSDQVVNAGSDQGKEAESAQGRISKVLHGLQWKFVEDEIRRKAGELLDIDVMEVIVSAWHGSKLMEELQKESKEKSGAAHVPLLKHNIYSELEPSIEIKLGRFRKIIPFHVVLEFSLDGLILKIEDQMIHAIEAGNLEGEGKIKIGHIPLPKRSFGPLELPGKIHLKKGIPLA